MIADGFGPTSKAAPRADDANIGGERKSVRRGGGLPRASLVTYFVLLLVEGV